MSANDMEFTGERMIPGRVDRILLQEHVARYKFALDYSNGLRILDAACGAGYGCYILASNAEHITGVDISTETKGNPFTHSCAHVHIVENGPRFDMALGDDGNIVADFIEFIFIHYIYNEWWEWVKDTCERFTQGNFISDFPLERIEDAFKEGKTDIMLRELEQYIVQMKSELNKRKCNMCELRLSKPVQGIMKYPI